MELVRHSPWVLTGCLSPTQVSGTRYAGLAAPQCRPSGAHGSAFHLAHSSSKLFSADRRSCTHTLRNVHFLCHGLPRDQRVVTPAVHTAARGYPPAHIGPNSAPPRCSARAPPRQSHGVEALLLRFGTLLVSHVGVHATRHFFRCLPVRPSRAPRRARLPSDRVRGMRSRSFGSVRSPSCWKITSFPAVSTSSSWAFRSFCDVAELHLHGVPVLRRRGLATLRDAHVLRHNAQALHGVTHAALQVDQGLLRVPTSSAGCARCSSARTHHASAWHP
mmetsp:Transcript_77073/g.216335  ORF Transcript_77073/g.216335 Transcript_77073/m.216335 type:complete len:275 (-) Transcript_77073:1297-2121(-)